MTEVTWNNTIKAQFNSFDIKHMKQITGNALKLDDYESVKTWAGQIWAQVSQGFMPPGSPWNQTFLDNFQTWMNNGMPLGDSGGGGGSGGGGSGSVTWTNTIKGQFTSFDVSHMKQVTGGSLDLSSYDSVKANADDVFGMVSTGAMPPGNPWSQQFVQNFKAWMDAGMPEGDAGGGAGTGGAGGGVGAGGGSGSGSGAGGITWTNTIKGQFTPFDVSHMKQVTGGDLDLSSYDSVKANADDVFGMVSTGAMPPGNPWSQQFVQNFKAWMDAGMPEGGAGGGAGTGGAGGGVGAGGGSGSGSGAGGITWTNTIKGQFTPFDISHMKQVTGGDLDLSSYDSVKANGSSVYEAVSKGYMPPGNHWSDQFLQNFKVWMDAGYPES